MFVFWDNFLKPFYIICSIQRLLGLAVKVKLASLAGLFYLSRFAFFIMSVSPVRAVLSWQSCTALLSRHTCLRGPVLPVVFCRVRSAFLFFLSYSACSVLPASFCLSVLPVPFCLSLSACPAVAVLLCLRLSGCPVLVIMAVLFCHVLVGLTWVQSSPGSPVLMISPGDPALAILPCCLVMDVLFCFSCSVCSGLPVLVWLPFWLFCSGCHVRAIL